MKPRWFELPEGALRIRTLRPEQRYLTLVDACEAWDELALAISQLGAAIDVRMPKRGSSGENDR